ncbi:MAG: VOC family protein [bacterium]|nr:VOC family protein [bacterium]
MLRILLSHIMTITNINHSSFTVLDVEKLARFYNEVMGLRLLDLSLRSGEFSEIATGIKGVQLKIAYLDGGNCSLELVEYIPGSGKYSDTKTSSIGSAHVCFNVNNILEFVENFKKGGGTLVAPLATIPGGPNKGKKMAYAKDPEGNTIEFISNETYE